jgi:hypothetical protein
MPNITQEQYDAAVKAGIIKPASDWYEPQKKELYWYLDGDFVCSATNNVSVIDKAIFVCQQVFRTEEEAEKENRKRVALTTIKRWCALNALFTPDWANDKEEKYLINYSHSPKGFGIMTDYSFQVATKIPYLTTKEDAQKLISLFDKELRIIFEIE